jgi:hypothetical protein
MEKRPLSIEEILQKKPDATVGDIPHPYEKHIPTDNEKIIQMQQDIDDHIHRLESEYQSLFQNMLARFPNDTYVANMIDDLDPTEMIKKLKRVQDELLKL